MLLCVSKLLFCFLISFYWKVLTSCFYCMTWTHKSTEWYYFLKLILRYFCFFVRGGLVQLPPVPVTERVPQSSFNSLRIFIQYVICVLLEKTKQKKNGENKTEKQKGNTFTSLSTATQWNCFDAESRYVDHKAGLSSKDGNNSRKRCNFNVTNLFTSLYISIFFFYYASFNSYKVLSVYYKILHCFTVTFNAI